MRIKKTFFSTEIEITPTELVDFVYKLPPNDTIFTMILNLLEKITK